MNQFDLLADVANYLKLAGIDHMLAGSYASTFYGEPRMTQDIDIVIDPNEATLQAFLDQLDGDRFYVGDGLAALARRDMFNMVEVKTGWKVDLIIRKDRAFSESEFARRRAADFPGVQTWVASAEDTILAKLEWQKLSGSERQFRDVVGVLKMNSEEVQMDYLLLWAERLGLSDELQLALQTAAD